VEFAMSRRIDASLLIACLGLWLFSGCGGAASDAPVLVTVRGNITLDGKPLATGEVLFVPADGVGRSDAAPISAGQYEMKCTVGDKTVSITANEEVPSKTPGGIPDYIKLVPAKYNSKTTLKASVTGDKESTIDFKLDK
jgi:hypothetical protein